MDKSAPEENTDFEEKTGARVDPILSHLQVPDVEFDKNNIRNLFIKLWEYENADELDAEDQHLTTIGIFIYASHNILSDYNIRFDRARESIVKALRDWVKPEEEKLIAAEKATENPFKAFVDGNVSRVDDIYTWKNFLLEHKETSEKQWKYKMKKCWFAEFFIRLGRTDYIETACEFDKTPWEMRKDYVDLKLENMFAKLGRLCQFTYKPQKPEKDS